MSPAVVPLPPVAEVFAPIEQINKPPEGVVLPPKDLRGMFLSPRAYSLTRIGELTVTIRRTAIVEKTAGYVARNGQVFERKCSVSSPPVYFLEADSW